MPSRQTVNVEFVGSFVEKTTLAERVFGPAGLKDTLNVCEDWGAIECDAGEIVNSPAFGPDGVPGVTTRFAAPAGAVLRNVIRACPVAGSVWLTVPAFAQFPAAGAVCDATGDACVQVFGPGGLTVNVVVSEQPVVVFWNVTVTFTGPSCVPCAGGGPGIVQATVGKSKPDVGRANVNACGVDGSVT